MGRQSGEVPSRTFNAGDVIFKEGDDAKSEAFLVHEGKVEVRKNLGGKDTLLRVLGKGELLGELALFRNAPRSASAVAAEAVTLLLIPANRLEAMVRTNPALALWGHENDDAHADGGHAKNPHADNDDRASGASGPAIELTLSAYGLDRIRCREGV